LTTSALVSLPKIIRANEVFEVRLLIAHAMESGFRPGNFGQILARNIVRTVQCKFQNVIVFEAQFFPAVAANPLLVFSLKVPSSGELEIVWMGDNNFIHRETALVNLA
jgi:sulfur-oxidizing protein SoxZ